MVAVTGKLASTFRSPFASQILVARRESILTHALHLLLAFMDELSSYYLETSNPGKCLSLFFC